MRQLFRLVRPVRPGQQLAVACALVLVYNILAIKFNGTLIDNEYWYTFWVDLAIFFLPPASIVAGMGALGRSRRMGAVSGMVLGITMFVSVYIAALLNGQKIQRLHLYPEDFVALAALLACGALLGAAGAQVRRLVSEQ